MDTNDRLTNSTDDLTRRASTTPNTTTTSRTTLDDDLRADGAANPGDEIGEAVGGISGVLTGAALGSLGGPVGTIIGGIAGAVSGWWAGRAISEAASHATDEDEAYYRSDYDRQAGRGSMDLGTSTASGAVGSMGLADSYVAEATTNPSAGRTMSVSNPASVSNSGSVSDPALTPSVGSTRGYDDVRPAYQIGHLAGRNPDYQGRSFDDVEGDLRQGWTSDVSTRHGSWDDVRGYARSAYDRSRTLSGSSSMSSTSDTAGGMNAGTNAVADGLAGGSAARRGMGTVDSPSGGEGAWDRTKDVARDAGDAVGRAWDKTKAGAENLGHRAANTLDDAADRRV